MILPLIAKQRTLPGWPLIGLFVTVFILHKPAYLNTGDLYFWVGLLSLPFSYLPQKGETSKRFLWWALGFALLSIPFPSTIGLYCMLIFSLLYILEQVEGKNNLILAFHLLLLSPLFQYFESLISFPIRLALSATAGHLLDFAGLDIAVSGNLISLNGADFLVDSACSGLFMLRYSFLFALLMLAHFQRKEKHWDLKEIVALFAGLFILNILTNLVRIVLLIVFKIMPETWFHEVLGLILFLLYCLLPFYFLLCYWAKSKSPKKPAKATKPTSGIQPAVPILLLLAFTGLCWKNSLREQKESSLSKDYPTNYQAEKLNNGVYKLSTDKALIYLKPPVEAYHADHNPLICWKGSGYDFKHINTTSINGLEVSVAELIKGEDKLYTMWWFDSGKHQTGSQWSWRWRSLRQQENFYLVNITAESRQTLRQEAGSLLAKKLVD